MQCNIDSKKVKSAELYIPLKFILQVLWIFGFNLFYGYGLWVVSYLRIHGPESYSYGNILQMTFDTVYVHCLFVLLDLDPNED